MPFPQVRKVKRYFCHALRFSGTESMTKVIHQSSVIRSLFTTLCRYGGQHGVDAAVGIAACEKFSLMIHHKLLGQHLSSRKGHESADVPDIFFNGERTFSSRRRCAVNGSRSAGVRITVFIQEALPILSIICVPLRYAFLFYPISPHFCTAAAMVERSRQAQPHTQSCRAGICTNPAGSIYTLENTAISRGIYGSRKVKCALLHGQQSQYAVFCR